MAKLAIIALQIMIATLIINAQIGFQALNLMEENVLQINVMIRLLIPTIK